MLLKATSLSLKNRLDLNGPGHHVTSTLAIPFRFHSTMTHQATVVTQAPRPLDAEQAQELRELFIAIGYSQQNLQELTYFTVPPPTDVVTEEQLQIRPTDQLQQFDISRLAILIRLFYFGMPVIHEVAITALGESLAQACIDTGMLAQTDDELVPNILIMPVGDLFVASDLQRMYLQDSLNYVPTLCEAAFNLHNTTVTGNFTSGLDLCSGFGLHAVAMQSQCQQVTATDLNPRAAEFAAFNAALNGQPPIEALTGNMLEPVADRTFDLIVSNPPFIINPDQITTYRFNPKPLDELFEVLIRSAHQHLNDGGVFQTIGEWVEFSGQDWEERLKTWTANSGCCVWVLTANRYLPSTYADIALRQSIVDEAQRLAEVARWESYFQAASVEAIHGGLIFMRRTTGNCWFETTKLSQALNQPVGKDVLEGFDVRDLLNDEDWLTKIQSRKLVVADGLQQSEVSEWHLGRWKTTSIELATTSGLVVAMNVDQFVRTLLEQFDGVRTVDQAVKSFLTKCSLPEEAYEKGLHIASSMLKTGALRLHSEA